MPIVENENQTDAYYVCDFCEQKIEDPEENVVCCSLSERIICPTCNTPLRSLNSTRF